jgi:hypothetical protein
VDERREQRSAVGRDARFVTRCPMVVMMVAHSGSSYNGILARYHPFSRNPASVMIFGACLDDAA